MFKKVLTALATGLASGIAVAAGHWAWKNCLESKVNDLKQEYDQKKENSQIAEEC